MRLAAHCDLHEGRHCASPLYCYFFFKILWLYTLLRVKIMMQPSEESGDITGESAVYQLPFAASFEGVHANFNTVNNQIVQIVTEMKKNSEVTNQNMTRLAEETSQNIEKLATDLKAIFSAQHMIVMLCFLAACLLGLGVVGIIKLYFTIF